MDGLTQERQALLSRLAMENGLTEGQMAARLVAEELLRLLDIENKVVPWKRPVGRVVHE